MFYYYCHYYYYYYYYHYHYHYHHHYYYLLLGAPAELGASRVRLCQQHGLRGRDAG